MGYKKVWIKALSEYVSLKETTALRNSMDKFTIDILVYDIYLLLTISITYYIIIFPKKQTF